MKLEEFEKKCRDAKLNDTLLRERYDKLSSQQSKYLKSCYEPKSRFNFIKLRTDYICPACGNILNKEHIGYACSWGDDCYERVILSCGLCKYKYAKEI